MHIEVHDKLGNPQRIEVTRVVVYDIKDNPIALAVETDPGVIITANADDKGEFNHMLRALGISRTTIVTDVSQQPTKDVQIIRP